VGTGPNDAPIIMVETHGGLFACFMKAGDKVEPISAMNHLALASWVAEKRIPGATWNKAVLSGWNNGRS